MRRPNVGRLIAGLFAATIVSLICIDTTMACRWLFRRGCSAADQVSACSAPAPTSCTPACQPACEPAPPTSCCPEVVAPPVVDSSCCGSTVEYGAPVIESYPSESYPIESYDSGIPIEAAPVAPSYVEGTTVVDPEPAPAPVVAAEGEANEVPEPTEADAPPQPEVADEAAEGEDAFDALPDEPADDGFEDAFDAPADEPADDALDAFSEPADAPADDATDFGGFDEPADAPADDLPGFNEAPADDGGLPGFDDAPADDGGLPGFGDETPADALPADPPANDGGDSLDDLFGVQPAPRGLQEVSTSIRPEPVSLPERLWTDNTGLYKTRGRLVKISLTHVRLLKDNGRFSTVPKNRLSQVDMDYVQQMTAKLGIEDFEKFALR